MYISDTRNRNVFIKAWIREYIAFCQNNVTYYGYRTDVYPSYREIVSDLKRDLEDNDFSTSNINVDKIYDKIIDNLAYREINDDGDITIEFLHPIDNN